MHRTVLPKSCQNQLGVKSKHIAHLKIAFSDIFRQHPHSFLSQQSLFTAHSGFFSLVTVTPLLLHYSTILLYYSLSLYTQQKLIGNGIHDKLRLTENAYEGRSARWMSYISNLKSARSSWRAKVAQSLLSPLLTVTHPRFVSSRVEVHVFSKITVWVMMFIHQRW